MAKRSSSRPGSARCDRRGLLVDLLVHEVRRGRRCRVAVDRVEGCGCAGRRRASRVQVRKPSARSDRQLAVVEVDDLPGVRTSADTSEATNISFSPMPEHDRAAVAGDDDAVRDRRRDDGDAVGADDLGERRGDRVLQVAPSAARRDQVGEHLGVGLGAELDPGQHAARSSSRSR